MAPPMTSALDPTSPDTSACPTAGGRAPAGEGEQYAADLRARPPVGADGAADDQRAGPDKPEHQCLPHRRGPPSGWSATFDGIHHLLALLHAHDASAASPVRTP